MIGILFVCHGNICRSPMAEFVMKDLVRQRGLEWKYMIASAATSSEELGNPVYPPAQRKLAEHGIECWGKTARRLTKADYEEYDLLIGMDRMNLRNMQRLFGGDPEEKIHLLMDYTNRPPTGHPEKKKRTLCSDEVADPWYTGDFEETWQDVNAGCRGLLETLEEA